MLVLDASLTGWFLVRGLNDGAAPLDLTAVDSSSGMCLSVFVCR